MPPITPPTIVPVGVEVEESVAEFESDVLRVEVEESTAEFGAAVVGDGNCEEEVIEDVDVGMRLVLVDVMVLVIIIIEKVGGG